MKLWVAAIAAGRGRVLLLCSLLVSCGSDATGPVPPGPDQRGVLFIGNSLTFANDLPAMLESLLEAELDDDFYMVSHAFPNFGLADHWEAGRAVELIRLDGWEAVVLQQGPSATEGRPSLLELSAAFAQEIGAVGASPALYMVWPAEVRSFDFDGVLDSYRTAAENVGGLFFPAGESWRIAWEEDPQLPLYASDGFHPSVLGTYLAALVMYEQLSGRDARDLPPTVPIAGSVTSIDPARAAILQRAAHEANVRHARPPGP